MEPIALPVLNCEQCGHTWHPRTTEPVFCPRCQKRYTSDEPKKKP